MVLFQDLLLGDSCCFDFSGELSSTGSADWEMRCCHQEEGGPVIPPREDVGEEQILQVININTIRYMSKDNFLTAGLHSKLHGGSQ